MVPLPHPHALHLNLRLELRDGQVPRSTDTSESSNSREALTIKDLSGVPVQWLANQSGLGSINGQVGGQTLSSGDQVPP